MCTTPVWKHCFKVCHRPWWIFQMKELVLVNRYIPLLFQTYFIPFLHTLLPTFTLAVKHWLWLGYLNMNNRIYYLSLQKNIHMYICICPHQYKVVRLLPIYKKCSIQDKICIWCTTLLERNIPFMIFWNSLMPYIWQTLAFRTYSYMKLPFPIYFTNHQQQ